MSQIPVEYILPVNVKKMGPIEAHAKTVEAALWRDSEIRRREECREAAPCVRFDSAAPGGLVPAGTTFSSWQRAGRWDPLQAALLVCGFNPKGYRNEVIEGIPVIYARRLSGGTAAHRDAFACVREVEELLSRRADPESKVIPSEFVQWCRNEGLDTRWIDSAGEPIPALPKDEQVKAQQDECEIGGLEEQWQVFQPERADELTVALRVFLMQCLDRREPKPRARAVFTAWEKEKPIGLETVSKDLIRFFDGKKYQAIDQSALQKRINRLTKRPQQPAKSR